MKQHDKKHVQHVPHSDILEPDLVEKLNEAQDAFLPSASAKKRMQNSLLLKIKAQKAEKNRRPAALPEAQSRVDKSAKEAREKGLEPRSFVDTLTIRAKEGQWIEIRPKVEIKPLHLDRRAGNRSFLMRLQPGARWPTHEHTHDEECIVLEGDVSIGDLTVSTGDYHLAPKGVTHGELHSEHGALLFLRAGIADTEPDLGTKTAYVWRELNTRWKRLWRERTS